MKTTFEIAVDFTLRKDIEGGYTVDSGGPTNRGITLRTLQEADRRGIVDGDFNKDGKVDAEDIKLLDEPSAILIYKALYWDSLDLDVVQDKKLAVCAFDTAVNCGVSRADRWLTKCELERKTYVYFLNFRVMYYLEVIKRNPEKYGRYKNGWLRRVNELKKYVDDPEVLNDSTSG